MGFVHQQLQHDSTCFMQQGLAPNEITLSFCDSYELRVFPCSKITKIFLALLCQCSIGPPKKHPQFVASFTASS